MKPARMPPAPVVGHSPWSGRQPKKRRKRAQLTEEQQRAKHERWIENARQMARIAAAKQAHAQYVASLPPLPDPRLTVLQLARGGDEYSAWRADELYGAGWRADRQVEA